MSKSRMCNDGYDIDDPTETQQEGGSGGDEQAEGNTQAEAE